MYTIICEILTAMSLASCSVGYRRPRKRVGILRHAQRMYHTLTLSAYCTNLRDGKASVHRATSHNADLALINVALP